MKKKSIITLSTALILALTFTGVSHLVYNRSVMASLSEFYMIAIDRDKIYEEGEDYENNVNLNKTIHIQEHTKPSGVKMDIPYYSRHEHKMQVFYFNEEVFTDTLIVYIPGGGYLNNPLKYHWKIINRLSKETNKPVVMPIYLKVPTYTCEESYAAMTEFYLDLATREGVEKIIFVGDSSGGGMSLVLAQLIRDNYPELIQPSELILLAPWLDVSMENEEIPDIEPFDPMLGLYGTVELGKMWAGNRDVHDPLVSPIYGTFENLGRITMFVGTRDMLYPDCKKFSAMLNEQGIEHTFIVEKGLDHPYVLFPIPEATDAQNLMINIISS